MSKILFITALFLIQSSCSPQVNKSKTTQNIKVNIPTIEQEASSIWRTINDITFLEKQGYNINLPENETIQSLIEKSKNNNFGNADFAAIYNLLESNIYNKADYEKALKEVKAQENLLNSLVKELKTNKASWNWDFKVFDVYNVIFTLYGTGGSYDPDNGRVTLYTNLKGEFMNYKKPANTIIHEIVHMGIEESIVQNYNLPHGLKEQIVDKITYILFKDQLTNYKIQNMGDKKIDAYIKSKKDLKQLNSSIEHYLKEK